MMDRQRTGIGYLIVEGQWYRLRYQSYHSLWVGVRETIFSVCFNFFASSGNLHGREVVTYGWDYKPKRDNIVL